MKNKKLLFPALLPLMVMIGLGFKTMFKYLDTPSDWHFIAAALGVFIFCGMALILVIRTLKQNPAHDKA
jgi:hypothetical protein